MVAFGFLFLIFTVLGCLFGWLGYFNSKRLEMELKTVKDQISRLQGQTGVKPSTPEAQTKAKPPAPQVAKLDAAAAIAAPAPTPAAKQDDVWKSPAGSTKPSGKPAPRPEPVRTKAASSTRTPFAEHLIKNWMIWLGGTCIALAGIFLVRYSMAAGLIGPGLRVSSGVIVGLTLHGIAEFLRRKNKGPMDSLAALAGAASVMLFAALLAALHLYQLVPPMFAFALLAIVALATMFLALLHGPVLAVFGILAAYAVPVLVGSEDANTLAALIYAGIITSAGFLLMQRVYRDWIWYGVCVGATFWWFLALKNEAELLAAVYMWLFAYACHAAIRHNWLGWWKLAHQDTDTSLSTDAFCIKRAPIVVTQWGLLGALAISLVFAGNNLTELCFQLPLVALLYQAAQRKQKFDSLAFSIQPVFLGAYLLLTPLLDTFTYSATESFVYFSGFAIVFAGLGLRQILQGSSKLPWLPVIILTPILWALAAHWKIDNLFRSSGWSEVWAIVGFAYTGATMALLKSARLREHFNKLNWDLVLSWLIVACVSSFSLALNNYFRSASLTLALASELIALAWLYSKFPSKHLEWMIKAVLGLVLFRITISPVLHDYDASVHWTLWGIGGATVCAAIATGILRLSNAPHTIEMRRWLEMGSLQLFIFFLWGETRFWLYDGDIFKSTITLTEAGLNVATWSSMALVYHLRSTVSTSLEKYYRFMSIALLVFSAWSYAQIIFALNPLSDVNAQIGSTPIFNILLLTHGVPSVMCALLYRFHEKAFKTYFAVAAAITGFIFVNMEIHHLWTRGNMTDLQLADGELYTYSAIWLVIAFSAMVAGSKKYGKRVYQGGLILLAAAIGKVFLVDTSGLEGLWRVMSFMLLGLLLLGFSYFHQRLKPVSKETETPVSP